MAGISFGQSLKDLEDYSVDKIFKKIEVDSGTLDDEGGGNRVYSCGDRTGYWFIRDKFN